MNRHYTADEYYELSVKLRNTFKNCTLTTDIMVGFPTETEKDFEETVAFAEKVGFEKIHIFPYSVRTGTRAALMKPQIEKHVKEERAAALAVTAEKIRSAFLRSQIGKTVSIIPETHEKEGFVFGYTENYTPVMAKVSKDTIGKTVLVKITDSDKDYCYAKSV